jgi:hypothetical protein
MAQVWPGSEGVVSLITFSFSKKISLPFLFLLQSRIMCLFLEKKLDYVSLMSHCPVHNHRDIKSILSLLPPQLVYGRIFDKRLLVDSFCQPNTNLMLIGLMEKSTGLQINLPWSNRCRCDLTWRSTHEVWVLSEGITSKFVGMWQQLDDQAMCLA